MKKITLILLIICSAISSMAEQINGIVYVKPGATGTGSSWTDAMGNIQDAITAAKAVSTARKDVWVAAGEYTVTTAITVLDSISLYGGFAGTETSLTERAKVAGGNAWDFVNVTTLKGSGARLTQMGGNFDMLTTIDGFTMTNGNGVGSTLSASGGAIVVRGNVVYQNCILRSNTATGSGGAATMTGGTIRYCLIENNAQNTSANGGGGIFSNPATGTPAYIENCIVRGNTSTVRGAGIGIQGSEMTYVKNVQIYNNSAITGTTLLGGGAIYVNSANNKIYNCLIFNNSGSSAIYLNGGTFMNNTVVKNVGGLYAASNAISVANNIVWGCYTDAAATTATSITGTTNTANVMSNNITYNALPTDKSWTLTDNLLFSSNATNGDVTTPPAGTLGSGPKFSKVSSFIGVSTNDTQKDELLQANWSLTSASPCIDRGKAVIDVTTDLVGVVRPQNNSYDVGAYEYSTTSPVENITGNNTALFIVGNKEVIATVACNVQIYSATGALLKTTHINEGEKIQLERGIYVLLANAAGKKQVQKVIL